MILRVPQGLWETRKLAVFITENMETSDLLIKVETGEQLDISFWGAFIKKLGIGEILEKFGKKRDYGFFLGNMGA